MFIPVVALAQTPTQRVLFGAFVASALINLAANLSGMGGAGLIFASKVLLIPTLAALLYLRTRGLHSDIPLPSIFTALGLCWVGDIALGLPAPWLFMVGMGAFGLAHLFYIRAFLHGVKWRGLPTGKALLQGLPIAIYGYTLYSVIHACLEGEYQRYRLPILLYTVVLLSSALASLVRKSQTGSPAATSILVGAVLFVQSDSILVLSRFVSPLPAADFSVMATYILGQSLIVAGCVLGARKKAPVVEMPRMAPIRFAA